MKRPPLLPLLALLSVVFASAQAMAQNIEQSLRPGDSIAIKLSGVPAEEIAVVNNTYDISDGGMINLPYIGEVRASGLRPSQLQKNIEAAYRTAEIFTHPTIQVSANKDSPTMVLYVS